MSPDIRDVLIMLTFLNLCQVSIIYKGYDSELKRKSGGNNQGGGKKEKLTWWRLSGLSSGFQRLASLSGPLLSLALASFAFCGERR